MEDQQINNILTNESLSDEEKVQAILEGEEITNADEFLTALLLEIIGGEQLIEGKIYFIQSSSGVWKKVRG